MERYIRDINKSKGRFISIAAIITLGSNAFYWC